MISEDDVKKLAILARLSIPAQKLSAYAQQLNGILEYVARLNEVSTDGVEPLSHVHGITNVMRQDGMVTRTEPESPPIKEAAIPAQGMLPIDDLLQNAPDSTGRFIKVPLIVE